MKLDTDPFPVGMVELMDKKVLVRTDQAKMTKGKNVVVSDELRNQMIKPHNLEIGMWKENVLQKVAKRVKPTSAMLIEKYQWQLAEDWRYQVTRGIKRDRFFEAQNQLDQREPWHIGESWRRLAHHSMDQAPWQPISQVLEIRIVVIIPMCCARKRNWHGSRSKSRSTS
jgi:hypothetical protein